MERDFEGYFGGAARPEPARMSVTARELQVIAYLSHGLREPAICDAMGIARDTVKTHVAHAKHGLGAKTTPHLVAIALRLGLID